MHDRPLEARPTRLPAWASAVLRALGWGAALYLSGRLGLLTTVHHQPLPLVTPSTAVGAVWFAIVTRRTLPYDVVAMSVAQAALSWHLGLPLGLVLVAPVISLAGYGLFAVVLRKGSPDLAPIGTAREAWRLRDLGVFMVAAVLSSLALAALATLTQAMAGLDTGAELPFLVRWGRGASTVVALGSLGLMLLAAQRRIVTGGVRTWLSRARHVGPGRLGEGLLLWVVSGVTYYLCFETYEHLPITFVLFLVTAWAGVRFSPPVVAAHAAALGSLAVLFTLDGHGRFATIDNPLEVALVAQLFVLVVSATGLTLAVSRSEQAAAEKLADDRAQLLDDVLYNADDGVVVADENGRYVFTNPAAARLLGFVPERYSATLLPYDLLDAESNLLQPERHPFARAIGGEHVEREEIVLRWKDGSRVTRLRLNARLLSDEGRGPRVLINFHDITADREREDALASFAGHVAHDLKNPLSVVHAWTETLQDAFADDGVVTAATGLPMTAKIERASNRMRDFIQELLDYTLARDRALRPQEVDLAEVATDVAHLRTLATPDVATLIGVTGAGTAWADPVLVRIVLDNLVANAVKYVAPGVDPRVDIAITQHDPEWVEVRVSDNGIGIAAEEQQRVFESFVRVGAGSYEGTGLGLGICHQIVARHGGTIEVLERDEGSCLRFTLPGRVVAPASLVAPAVAE